MMAAYFKTPPVKNTGGWLLLSVAIPDFTKAVRICYNTSIRSELLAVYLAEKSGETLVLEDPFTRKPYGHTAKGIPFSVGWDGKAGTPDDIVLGTIPK